MVRGRRGVVVVLLLLCLLLLGLLLLLLLLHLRDLCVRQAAWLPIKVCQVGVLLGLLLRGAGLVVVQLVLVLVHGLQVDGAERQGPALGAHPLPTLLLVRRTDRAGVRAATWTACLGTWMAADGKGSTWGRAWLLDGAAIGWGDERTAHVA